MKMRLNFLLGVVCLLACHLAWAANPKVILETNQGNITLELDAEKAPVTVKNFLQYVASGFYQDTIFHRVMNGFMIQGGGFTASMAQKETQAPIVNESHNGLSNEAGTIAMARTYEPNSATAQFFINLQNNPMLNYRGPDPDSIGYCVFGRVTQGMDVVHQIATRPTTYVGQHANVPQTPVIIQRVRIVDVQSKTK